MVKISGTGIIGSSNHQVLIGSTFKPLDKEYLNSLLSSNSYPSGKLLFDPENNEISLYLGRSHVQFPETKHFKGFFNVMHDLSNRKGGTYTQIQIISRAMTPNFTELEKVAVAMKKLLKELGFEEGSEAKTGLNQKPSKGTFLTERSVGININVFV